MRTIHFRLLALAVLPVLVAGCGKKNDPPPYVLSSAVPASVPWRQEYVASWREADASSSLSAQFKTDNAYGSRIRLDGNASVTANGQRLSPDTLTQPPTNYSWYTASLEDLQVRLRKDDGSVAAHTFSFREVDNFDFAGSLPPAFPRAAGITVGYSGASLSGDEYIQAVISGASINDSTKGASTLQKIMTDSSGRQVTFGPADLAHIRPGAVSIVLSKCRRVYLAAGSGFAYSLCDMYYTRTRHTYLQ